jgi:uncharacterized OB-fold protein
MATPAPYTKPLPKLEPDVRPYWDYLKQHRMHVQRCPSCERYYFPPSDYCPRCFSSDVAWTPVSGRGTVYSWVTMHRAYTPAYEGEIPYNVSLVDLEEGVRVWTNVVGCAPTDVYCGMPVQVVYEDVSDEIALARFQPIA